MSADRLTLIAECHGDNIFCNSYNGLFAGIDLYV